MLVWVQLAQFFRAFVATALKLKGEEGCEDQEPRNKAAAYPEHLTETALLGGAPFPGVTGRAGWQHTSVGANLCYTGASKSCSPPCPATCPGLVADLPGGSGYFPKAQHSELLPELGPKKQLQGFPQFAVITPRQLLPESGLFQGSWCPGIGGLSQNQEGALVHELPLQLFQLIKGGVGAELCCLWGTQVFVVLGKTCQK